MEQQQRSSAAQSGHSAAKMDHTPRLDGSGAGRATRRH